MNEVMIMRRGGGTKLFAAIGATYPEGYTCTCTGKNSGKVLTAKKSPWIFAIPEADEWTVAVSGGSNPSQTVNITHEGQVEKVNLGFSLVLFDGGDNTEVSGGWDAIDKQYPRIKKAVPRNPYNTLGILSKLTYLNHSLLVTRPYVRLAYVSMIELTYIPLNNSIPVKIDSLVVLRKHLGYEHTEIGSP